MASVTLWAELRCDSACGNRLALTESTVNNRTVGPELQMTMAKISSDADCLQIFYCCHLGE